MEAVAEITTAVKNVPVLRFPKFEGEWKEKRGADLFNNSRTKGNESLPIYSVTLDRGLVPRDSLERTMGNDAKATDNLYVAENDITYNMMRMWQGAYGLAKVNCMVSPAYVVLRPKNTVCPEFFVSLFSRSRSLYLFTAFSYGLTSDRLRLYYKDFARIKFAIPSILEQQKVASFLSAVDDKIRQLSKKKELLEKYKKGVMQQLFSQQIRFKDASGNDFPEWEQKRLGDVLEFYTTNSFSRSLLNYEDGAVKNIHYGDIHTKYKSNFDITKETVPYINGDVEISRIADSSYCQVGDLVVADASEDYKDIGKAIEIINLNGENVVAGLHTYIARDNNGVFALGFKGYLMQSRKVRVQMMRYATGVSVLGISKGNISKVEVGIPCYEEQQKIANFLTSIDDKINYTSKQLEQAQQFKKGLLQQLFV